MTKRIITLFIACVTVTTMTNSTQAALPEEERAVIALFGDSITAGENANLVGRQDVGGSTTHQGCPSVYLTGLLLNEASRGAAERCPTETLNSPIYDGNSEKRNAIVANWGIGGSSSTRGASRIGADLSQTKSQLVGNQYLVLIIYGTNDRARGISAMTTRANIESMILTAQSSSLNYEPIIGLVTPRDDRTGNNAASINALNSQIRSGAQSRGVQVVDHYSNFVNYPGGFFSVMDQETFGDLTIRIHPNDQGYLLIAEAWFEQALKNRIPVVPTLSISPIISLLLDD